MGGDLIRLLTLEDATTRTVLLGTALLGLAAGVAGCFALLRRRALMGDAIAHAALPGLCVAFFVVGDRNFAAFLLGALAFGTLAALVVTFVRAFTRVKEDAAIGIVIGSFFGLGIVLSRIIQNRPSGNRAGLDSFLFGKAASMVRSDAVMIAGVCAAVLVVVALLFKEFKAVAFDRDFAAGQGWPVLALDILIMALVCVCTVVGLPAVGVVLMVALLIIPAAAARFWTNRLWLMLVIAGVIGGVSGSMGTALSAVLPAPAEGLSRGWPTGPLIVLVAAGVFVVSLMFAPERGVIAHALRRARRRRKIGDDNLLRAAFEVEERAAGAGGWRREDLLGARAWTGAEVERLVARARRAGRVRAEGGTLALTERGAEDARRIVRAHRLWETFLIEQADIAPDHVDRDADDIEHFLSPELIDRLERRLREQGRLPGPAIASPHDTRVPMDRARPRGAP